MLMNPIIARTDNMLAMVNVCFGTTLTIIETASPSKHDWDLSIFSCDEGWKCVLKEIKRDG